MGQIIAKHPASDWLGKPLIEVLSYILDICPPWMELPDLKVCISSSMESPCPPAVYERLKTICTLCAIRTEQIIAQETCGNVERLILQLPLYSVETQWAFNETTFDHPRYSHAISHIINSEIMNTVFAVGDYTLVVDEKLQVKNVSHC